ncbi:hypothetical protein MASR1M6_27180 [Rubrivivax sp.]
MQRLRRGRLGSLSVPAIRRLDPGFELIDRLSLQAVLPALGEDLRGLIRITETDQGLDAADPMLRLPGVGLQAERKRGKASSGLPSLSASTPSPWLAGACPGCCCST